jgi:hypothetical protein
MITIQLRYISLEQGVQFMQDLIHEIVATQQGRHPNPAELPERASDWSFVRRLNQKAYDLISAD